MVVVVTISAPSSVEVGEVFSVYGVVYDDATGEPHEFVPVAIYRDQTIQDSTITEIGGTYFINTSISTAGQYELRAYSAGAWSDPLAITVGAPTPPPTVTLVATEDSFITERYPDENRGDRLDIRLANRHTYGNRRLRGYVQFDLAQIPSGVDVESAILSLFYYDGDAYDIEVQRVFGTFDEMAITWNDRPGIAGSPRVFPGPYPIGWIGLDVTEIFRLDAAIAFRIRQVGSIEGTTDMRRLGPIFYSKEQGAYYAPTLAVTYVEVVPGIETVITITAPGAVAPGEVFEVRGKLTTIAGDPLPGMEIELTVLEIPEILLRVDTDENGEYEFTLSLPQGTFTLKAEFAGTEAYGASRSTNPIFSASPLGMAVQIIGPIAAGTALLYLGR